MPKFMVSGNVSGCFGFIVEADNANAAREVVDDAYDDGDIFEDVDGVDFSCVKAREITEEPDGALRRLKQFKPGKQTGT